MKVTYQKRNIGILDEQTKTYTKHVRKSKHLFRSNNSWGFDFDFIEKYKTNDIAVRVYDDEENMLYETTMKDIWEKGIYDHFLKDGEDHGPQIFLERSHFKKTNV